MEDNEPVFKLIPRYNFIYELFMPTGKKVSKALKLFFILLIVYIILLVAYNTYNVKMPAAITNNINILNILNWIMISVLVIIGLSVIVYITFQIAQYKNTAFTFFDTYMTYEDNFLNQHKKTIQYINIREVEVRRNIWDRMNGYGVIVIYTNADNEFNNGLVIFGIKDPDSWYSKIDDLVHKNTSRAVDSENININNKSANSNIENENKKDEITKEEQNFKNSLKL